MRWSRLTDSYRAVAAPHRNHTSGCLSLKAVSNWIISTILGCRQCLANAYISLKRKRPLYLNAFLVGSLAKTVFGNQSYDLNLHHYIVIIKTSNLPILRIQWRQLPCIWPLISYYLTFLCILTNSAYHTYGNKRKWIVMDLSYPQVQALIWSDPRTGYQEINIAFPCLWLH